jgi:7,8-dihydro-6-hydroxymethylpterin-pyrophosphokinase
VLPQEPPPEPLPQAAIALGSNLGDCRSTLEQALGLLNQKVFVHTKKEKKEITKINRLRKKRAFGGLNL